MVFPWSDRALMAKRRVRAIRHLASVAAESRSASDARPKVRAAGRLMT